MTLRRFDPSPEMRIKLSKYLGECSCGPAWKDRGLASMDCEFCRSGPEVECLVEERDALRAALIAVWHSLSPEKVALDLFDQVSSALALGER